MSREQNLQVIGKLYDAFGRADLPTILSLVADDVDFHFIGPPHIPTASVRTGREGVSKFFIDVATHEDIRAFDVNTMIADGDHVAVAGSQSIVIRSTGKGFSCEWMHHWTLRDGKVVRYRGFSDSFAVAEAYRQ